jgi:hypothetical protein
MVMRRPTTRRVSPCRRRRSECGNGDSWAGAAGFHQRATTWAAQSLRCVWITSQRSASTVRAVALARGFASPTNDRTTGQGCGAEPGEPRATKSPAGNGAKPDHRDNERQRGSRRAQADRSDEARSSQRAFEPAVHRVDVGWSDAARFRPEPLLSEMLRGEQGGVDGAVGSGTTVVDLETILMVGDHGRCHRLRRCQ